MLESFELRERLAFLEAGEALAPAAGLRMVEGDFDGRAGGGVDCLAVGRRRGERESSRTSRRPVLRVTGRPLRPLVARPVLGERPRCFRPLPAIQKESVVGS